MKKLKFLLFALGIFALLGILRVDALRIFNYDKSSDSYGCASSGGTNELNSAYDSIQTLNRCYMGDSLALSNIDSNNGKSKYDCDAAGGTWVYTPLNSPYYGSCPVYSKDFL